MGLTVFAIGGCTPEMITGVIMARRGKRFEGQGKVAMGWGQRRSAALIVDIEQKPKCDTA